MGMGFLGSLVVKNLPANSGDTGSIPGSGRSLEEGMATQPSILAWRIPMDRGAWRATVHEVATELNVTERLNNSTGGIRYHS